MEAITTALTTGVSTVATECMDAVAAVVPVALPIAGAIIVVSLGLRIFKKVAR